MKKSLIRLMVCASFVYSVVPAFASPINLPESIKGNEGAFSGKNMPEGVGLSGAFQYDYFDREMKQGDKISSNFVGGKVTVSLLDRVDVYTTLGSTIGAEDTIDSSNKLSMTDNFMWGIGGNAVIYEWGKKDLALFADGGYREATGIDYDSITVNGVTYSKSVIDAATGANTKINASFQEWQAALGVSKNLSENVILFGGAQYSDAQIKGSASAGGSSIALGSEKSKGKVGPFVGVSIIPAKGVSIDVSGRFVDETAVSATVTVRF